MPYSHTVRGERFSFSDLRDLLAKANEVKSGDGLAGIAAASERERVAAKLALADVTLGEIVANPVVYPDTDDVSQLILFLVRFCRVGVMNDVGELLDPAVIVLLIGERPGLATAESLSAYLAYRPRPGHTDADRNLISNIHARGIGVPEAARRIGALARS